MLTVSNNTILRAVSLLMALCCVGCVSVKNENGLQPPVAAVYTDIACTIGSTQNVPVGTEVVAATGRQSYYFWEWVYTDIQVNLFEAKVNEIAAENGLKDIYYVDYAQFTLLGFYTAFDVTVYGK